MDLNEQLSPIDNNGNDIDNYQKQFQEPYQKVEFGKFSQSIVNEIQSLMDPKKNEPFKISRADKPLASRVIKDFRNSFKNSLFTSRVMKKLRELYWNKKKNSEKIQVTDKYNSNMGKWKNIMSQLN